MAERFVYRFAWDPEKAAANRGKHGVTFEQAGTVFRESLSLTGYRDVPAPKYAEDIADATDE